MVPLDSPMTASYNPLLVALSIVLAILSSYVALDLAGRVTASRGQARLSWLLGGSFAMGIGIWSMHYIGMLALQLPVAVEYHWPTVLFSLLAAVFASAVALLVVSRPAMKLKQAALGSLLMGGGIAAMHYVGMAAMDLPGMCHWTASLVILSVLLAVIISFVALWLAFHFREGKREGSSWSKIASSLLMGAAIPTMHYTGMAAVKFTHAHDSINRAYLIGISSLGVISICTVTIVALGTTLLLATIDRRFSAQNLAVEASEQRYRGLVESAQVVFWQRNPSTNRFSFVSSEAEKLLGYESREWLSNPNFWQDHISRDDGSVIACYHEAAFKGNHEKPYEHRMVSKNGTVIWVRTSVRLIGKPGGGHELVGVMFDVTQRKQVEEALEEQRRLFDALMDSSPDSIYFKDFESKFVRVNRAQARVLGLNDTAEAVGKSDEMFFASEHADQALRDEQEIIRTGKPLIDFEEKEVFPDGRIGWISSTKIPLRNSVGEVCGTIGISRNIMERKLAEQALQERTRELLAINAEFQREIAERRLLEGQLVQAQKLESIGQLAAGVAHEINTPIQYVGDNCRFFGDSFRQLDTVLGLYSKLLAEAKRMTFAAPLVNQIEQSIVEQDLPYLLEEIPSAIEQCNEGVERVAQIVRAMKEFSHPGSANMESVDLNHSIESTLAVCRNEWKYVAEAVLDLDPDLPPVRCLIGEIKQVVLNIVVNAAHAIAEGRQEGEQGRIIVTTRLDGDVAEIRIQDSGTGIPKSVQSRIFDPFFTTKEVGKGSGQGLAIARNVVVKKHGGALTFETEEGKGTTFLIQLPVRGLSGLNGEHTEMSFSDEQVFANV